MANLKNQDLKAGARVDLGEKKNYTDFALWKFSPTDEKRQMEWKSPWGVGFPGWHIECSAMSEKYLGQPFDIHCGGIDHIPVHHTNEIAQSEAANDKPLANYWLHNEFLNMGKEKMAKSGENFITIAALKEKNINPLAYRFFLLQAHYRKQVSFSWEALEAASNGLGRLKNIVAEILNEKETENENTKKYYTEFKECVNDDLNTPQALALTWKMLEDKNLTSGEKIWLVKKFDAVFGLKLTEHEAQEKVPQDILNLVAERDTARAEKDWAKSDTLRKNLEEAGYKVEDTPTGTKISRF